MSKKDFGGRIQTVKGWLSSALRQLAENGRDVTEGSQGQILCHFSSPIQYVGGVPGCSLEPGLKEGAC